jgi:hypothetical protein
MNGHAPTGLTMPRLVALCACALIGLAAFWLHAFHIVPNHDNDWLLVTAERMLDGGTFRNEFDEANPPLVIFVNIPPVMLARLFGLATYTAFSLYVSALILLSTALAGRFIAGCLQQDAWRTALAVIGYAAILAFLPGYEFGQRDHLAIILCLPSLLWFALREAGPPQDDQSSGALLVLVLALGAVGVLIRPFFAILPVVLVAGRLLRLRDWRVMFDPMLLALAIALALYAAAVFLGYPEYLEEAAIHRQVYFAWNRATLAVLSDSRDTIATFCLAALLALLVPMPRRTRVILGQLMLAAGVTLAVGLAQRNGYAYHLLPGIVIALLVALLVACGLLAELARGSANRLTTLALLGVIACQSGFIFVRPVTEFTYATRERFMTTPLVSTLRRLVAGRSFLIFTDGFQWGVPSLIGGRLAARAPSQTFLPGAALLALGNESQRAQAAALRPLVIAQLVEDLDRLRPAIVALDLRTRRQALPDGYDILGYYQDDPSFQRAWSAYRRVESAGGWDFYARNPD